MGSTNKKSRQIDRRPGLTLLELAAVLVILAILAALIVPSVTGLLEDSREQLTNASMREVQKVIVNRYKIDMADLPRADSSNLQPTSRSTEPQLYFLFVNPVNYSTTSQFNVLSTNSWQGPYLLSSSGFYPGQELFEETAEERGFTSAYGIPNSSRNSNDGDQTVLDAWGNPLVIKLEGAEYMLVSAGPDGCLIATTKHPDGQEDNIRLPLR